MTLLRRRLRLYVAAWLVFQSASLSALAARDCCRTHTGTAMGHDRTSRATAQTCEEPPAAAHCPMHAVRPSCDNAEEPTEPDRNCAMRGTCDGPMAALSALLSQHGVLPESTVLVNDVRPLAVAVTFSHDAFGRPAPPDTPPPRA